MEEDQYDRFPYRLEIHIRLTARMRSTPAAPCACFSTSTLRGRRVQHCASALPQPVRLGP
jgi:hypothetical protein